MELEKEEIKKRIIENLKKYPGTTLEYLSYVTGAKRDKVTECVRELEAKGAIRKKRVGKVTRHYLNKGYSKKLVKKPELELKGLRGKLKEVKSRRDLKLLFMLIPILGILYIWGSGITGFFVQQDLLESDGIFVVADNSWNGNELHLYTLMKRDFGGNVTKVIVSDLKNQDLSNYDWIYVSTDASSLMTDELCWMIADTSIPLLYSSKNFNSKCTDELNLTRGSTCGPNESPVWEIVENSRYPTSNLRVPRKIPIFKEEFSLDLCALEKTGSDSKPIVLAKRDENHGYLIIFEDDSRRRAFFAFPNHEFELTDEGETLFFRTMVWLVKTR